MPRHFNEIDAHIAKRLRAARLTAGMSQEVAAAVIGRTFQQLQKYEKGTNRVSAGTLAVLAMHFDVPVAWFYEGAPGLPKKAGNGLHELSNSFFSKPHAADLARDFLAIENADNRRVISNVAAAFNRAYSRSGEAAMYENWPKVPQATTFPRPANWRDDPNLTPRMKLLVEIERTVQNVFEANTVLLCDQLFLSAVTSILSKNASLNGEAARAFGMKSAQYTLAERLNDAHASFELAKALASWKGARSQDDDATELVEAAE